MRLFSGVYILCIYDLTPKRCTAMNRLSNLFLLCCLLYLPLRAQKLLIPMDNAQADHLKAYGVCYNQLVAGQSAHWLLNYRGGAFALVDTRGARLAARSAGVVFEPISNQEWTAILAEIKNKNMERVTLEKAPKIAVYTPPDKLPWDDAVTLALSYAEIPYETVYDPEVLSGKLAQYDWLHLHHEDFTGQYSKFYRSHAHTSWYQQAQARQQGIAAENGFADVPSLKKAVALALRRYVEQGGFLFAMCSATNTIDIALAALGADIVTEPFDGDGVDPEFQQKLQFENSLAFENFTVYPSADIGYFANIDVNLVNSPMRQEAMPFVLFSFSAKLDPVPTMLTQCHTQIIPGFFGLLTSYNRKVLKKHIIELAAVPGTNRVKYIHGVVGKGQFAFLGGHDPEDYSHAIGDEHTELSRHKNSPGYRLILNNALFPAAEKKEKKT